MSLVYRSAIVLACRGLRLACPGLQPGQPPIPEGEALSKSLDLFLVDHNIVLLEVVLRRFLEIDHLPAETVKDPDGEIVELAVDRDPMLGVGDIWAGGVLAWHE